MGATAGDVRDILVEGESGILEKSPPWFRPAWNPSKCRLTWPNGAIGITYSADEPDRLRGKQHHAALCDEFAAWRYAGDAWNQLQLGLRLGDDPRTAVTTTPRPTEELRELLADPLTVVTKGSTYENTGNLAAKFIAQIVKKYEGTRLGRQEIDAEMLGDTPGALWTLEQIESLRCKRGSVPELVRVVIGVDPSVTGTEESDECGIVVAGIGEDGHGYVFDDLSLQGSPGEWANAALGGYHDHKADRVVAEVNNGGDLVEANLRTVDKNFSYTAVRAARGKRARAEPIAALYEQKKVHHVGAFAKLENQMTTWDARTAMKSPDRLDALVWALTELMTGGDDSYESTAVSTSSR